MAVSAPSVKSSIPLSAGGDDFRLEFSRSKPRSPVTAGVDGLRLVGSMASRPQARVLHPTLALSQGVSQRTQSRCRFCALAGPRAPEAFLSGANSTHSTSRHSHIGPSCSLALQGITSFPTKFLRSHDSLPIWVKYFRRGAKFPTSGIAFPSVGLFLLVSERSTQRRRPFGMARLERISCPLRPVAHSFLPIQRSPFGYW